jgi:RNA polymerase sigma factor (sigma-70 family)
LKPTPLPGGNGRHAPPDPAQLVEQHYPAVFKYYRYRGLEAAEANDLASAVFERVLEKLPAYDPARGAFGTWLFAIARHMLSNHWRAERVRRAVPLAEVEQHASPEPLPEELALAREARAELLAALGTLTTHEQDLIALKFSARFTNRQIAALTGLTDSNVGVTLYRAMQKLRLRLAPQQEPHDAR